MSMRGRIAAGVLVAALPLTVMAQDVELEVSVENLSPTNSISFAPLRIGFNNGTFDSFNNGEAAGQPIISVAEGGTGVDWFPAFSAADPTATLGTVAPNPPGPLLPGGTGTGVFTVDSSVNQYFTFASMVVPSNDYFIGNDNPLAYDLFDDNGDLIISEITLTASDIWDAGSEVDGVFGAAFLQGSSNDDRIAEDSVVEFDFADLNVFNGSTTAAGYVFDSQLASDTDIYRISFTVVPEPATAMLLCTAGVFVLRRRR